MKNLKNIFGVLAVLIIGSMVMGMITLEEGGPGLAAIAVYNKQCSKNVGGNSAVFLTEAGNIDTVTVTTGEISAITMNSTETFHEVEADLDGVLHTQEGTGTANNISYLHRVEMFFAKPSAALNVLRDSLAAASPCGILALVQDGNGNVWMVGYNDTDKAKRPLRLVQDSMNSGNAPSDEDSQRVTVGLEGSSGYLSLPLDSTLAASVLDGSATFITFA